MNRWHHTNYVLQQEGLWYHPHPNYQNNNCDGIEIKENNKSINRDTIKLVLKEPKEETIDVQLVKPINKMLIRDQNPGLKSKSEHTYCDALEKVEDFVDEEGDNKDRKPITMKLQDGRSCLAYGTQAKELSKQTIGKTREIKRDKNIETCHKSKTKCTNFEKVR